MLKNTIEGEEEGGQRRFGKREKIEKEGIKNGRRGKREEKDGFVGGIYEGKECRTERMERK